jgi:Peptidase family M13
MFVPQIDWLRYFNMVMERKIDVTEKVVCFALPYFQDLVVLLSQTSPKYGITAFGNSFS